MKINDVLAEGPMDIEPIDWHDLNDIDKNKAEYNVLLTKKYKKLVERINKYATIYQLGSRIFCLDS